MLELVVHAAHAPIPPPPGGIPAPPWFFFGTSATMASVVIRRAATEAAFWIATRTTLVGSISWHGRFNPVEASCSAARTMCLSCALNTPLTMFDHCAFVLSGHGVREGEAVTASSR